MANSIILYRIIRARRKVGIQSLLHTYLSLTYRQAQKRQEERAAQGNQPLDDEEENTHHKNNMFMMRILGPVVQFVNRPWKVSIWQLAEFESGSLSLKEILDVSSRSIVWAR